MQRHAGQASLPQSSAEMRAGAAILAAALAGCAAVGAEPLAAEGPVTAAFLDADLLRVTLGVRGQADPEWLRRQTDCAAAAALIGHASNFARHVRTTVTEEGGISRADAVYTVSPTLPAGPAVIDAESVAAHCREQGTTGG